MNTDVLEDVMLMEEIKKELDELAQLLGARIKTIRNRARTSLETQQPAAQSVSPPDPTI